MIIVPGPSLMASGMSVSFRRMRGLVRKGQACPENVAQPRCIGASAEVRLTAHIGPITKHLCRASLEPQTQQRLSLIAMATLDASAKRISGTPLTRATNHGIGQPS